MRKFDLHNFPEVKIYVVFGKVINFKTHNHHYVGVRPNGDLFTYLGDSSHRRRLKSLNMEDDTRFCLSPPFNSDIIPILKGDELIILKDE